MTGDRKVTVHVSGELLEQAQEATGQGITATIRRGLELVAASRAYDEVRKLRGKVRFSLDLDDLRRERE